MVDIPAVAEHWKTHTNDDSMTLEKFKGCLDSCCQQATLQKVDGKTFTYKFLINIERYIIEHKSVITKAVF